MNTPVLLGRMGRDTKTSLENIIAYIKKGVHYKQVVVENLNILIKQNLWSKPPNCEFSKSKIEYLGQEISHKRVRMDLAEVKAVPDLRGQQNFTKSQHFNQIPKTLQFLPTIHQPILNTYLFSLTARKSASETRIQSNIVCWPSGNWNPGNWFEWSTTAKFCLGFICRAPISSKTPSNITS